MSSTGNSILHRAKLALQIADGSAKFFAAVAGAQLLSRVNKVTYEKGEELARDVVKTWAEGKKMKHVRDFVLLGLAGCPEMMKNEHFGEFSVYVVSELDWNWIGFGVRRMVRSSDG
jgi:hypothetical protein